MKRTRREFIEALVAAGFGLLASRARAEAPALATFFTDRAAAAAIGNEYLGRHQDERDATRLSELIAATDEALLREAIRSDFEKSRTVKIHGWVLAQTEARICALAAISAPA